MLTEQDKQEIDACLTRPESVWTLIKEIAVQKYDGYLTALEPTCNTEKRTKEFNEVRDRWLAVQGHV